MAKRLHDVVEEAPCGIAYILALPVREAVAQATFKLVNGQTNPSANSQNINTALDQWIGSAILELVPAVCRPNLELRKSRLNGLDLRQEFCTCEIATVHGLRADSDGIDLLWVLRRVRLDCFEV
jgi:hypothetical protein